MGSVLGSAVLAPNVHHIGNGDALINAYVVISIVVRGIVVILKGFERMATPLCWVLSWLLLKVAEVDRGHNGALSVFLEGR